MVPLVPTAYAATDVGTQLAPVLNPIITNIVNPLIVGAFALAVLVFVYGVVKMILTQGDTEAHSQGKWAMFGGLIGLFIMVSAWGLINLVYNTVETFR